MENKATVKQEDPEYILPDLDLSNFLEVDIVEAPPFMDNESKGVPAVAGMEGQSRLPQSGYNMGQVPTAGRPRCSPCQLDFQSNTELMEHAKIHGLIFQDNETEDSLMCTCGKNFGSGVELEEHKRNRFCYLCSRCFFHPYRLRKHEITHTGEKNFACVFCNKEYKQKPSLAYHYQANPICNSFKEGLKAD